MTSPVPLAVSAKKWSQPVNFFPIHSTTALNNGGFETRNSSMIFYLSLMRQVAGYLLIFDQTIIEHKLFEKWSIDQKSAKDMNRLRTNENSGNPAYEWKSIIEAKIRFNRWIFQTVFYFEYFTPFCVVYIFFYDYLDFSNGLTLMNKNIRDRIETIIGTGTSRIVQLQSDEARASTKSSDANFFNRQFVPTDMDDKNETRNNILWTVSMDLRIFVQNNIIVPRVLLIFYCECYSGYRSLPDFQENESWTFMLSELVPVLPLEWL